MKRLSLLILLLAVFAGGCCFLPIPVYYTHGAGVSGKVLEAGTDLPIPGAAVLVRTTSANRPDRSATTASDGSFRVPADWDVHFGVWAATPSAGTCIPRASFYEPRFHSVEIDAEGYEPGVWNSDCFSSARRPPDDGIYRLRPIGTRSPAADEPHAELTDSAGVEEVALDPGWPYADRSAIHTGSARLYRATENRKDAVVGVNAGHGTEGGASAKTYCHPDGSPKVTGGTTAAGSVMAVAVSGGMTFADGTPEAEATLAAARLLRDRLLAKGYDVLMLRDGADVQLDNVARTVIANRTADCLVSLHWDGDALAYDKGCFYISTPDGIKGMEPVSRHWREHERLGAALVEGLRGKGCRIHGNGKSAIDLTQTSYSTIPSVDVELGNQASAHDEATLSTLAEGLLDGIEAFFASGKPAHPATNAPAAERP